MFRWLFKKKDVQERRIRTIHVPEFIQKISKDSLKETELKIEHLRKNSAEVKEHILHDLTILEYASLHNEKIPERAKAIMQGNREHYCVRIKQALEKIHFPHDLHELASALSAANDELDSLGRDIQKNIMVLNEFFSHETGAVNKELGVLAHTVVEMKAMLESSGAKSIQEIWSEWEIYQEHLKESGEVKETIHLLEADDAELEKRQRKIEEKLNAIKTGAEFHAGISLQEDIKRLEEEQAKDFAKYDDAISTLQLALKKYAYGNPDEAFIQNYLENPLAALGADPELNVKAMLAKVEREIHEGTLLLKDKKRQKSLEAIKYIAAHAALLQTTLAQYTEKRRTIQKRLGQNNAYLNLAEQEKFLSIIEQERRAIQSKIKEFQQDLTLKDPSFALRAIEKLLTSLAQMSVIIVD